MTMPVSIAATHMTAGQWLLLIVLAVLWGGSFLFIGIAVKELPPLTIALLRVALAAGILIPVVYALRLNLPSGIGQWQPFFVMAILNNVIPFTLIISGQREIASGLASVLNATTPVFALLVAHFFTTDEKLKANKLAGVLVGLGGVAVLVGPEAMFGRVSSTIGMLCILGAALSYGFSGLWGRRLRNNPPLVTAASQLICSTVVLLPFCLLLERPWTLDVPSTEVFAALIGLAALATALAYILFFRIMAVSGSTNVMLVTLLIPLVAIPLGAWRLGEVLQTRHFIGALIIGLSLIVIDGRLLRQRALA
jgi:drug/metabolite transporter (DMT)-like permease